MEVSGEHQVTVDFLRMIVTPFRESMYEFPATLLMPSEISSNDTLNNARENHGKDSCCSPSAPSAPSFTAYSAPCPSRSSDSIPVGPVRVLCVPPQSPEMFRVLLWVHPSCTPELAAFHTFTPSPRVSIRTLPLLRFMLRGEYASSVLSRVLIVEDNDPHASLLRAVLGHRALDQLHAGASVAVTSVDPRLNIPGKVPHRKIGKMGGGNSTTRLNKVDRKPRGEAVGNAEGSDQDAPVATEAVKDHARLLREVFLDCFLCSEFTSLPVYIFLFVFCFV